MDTRSKIVTADAVRDARPVLATGYFDVLTAHLVRELRAVRERYPEGPLAAAVLPCEGALLGQRARAEMLAALSVIDYVLIAEAQDSERLLESIAARETVRLEEADRLRNRQLRDHVRRRNSR
jgi:hypothetical protein